MEALKLAQALRKKQVRVLVEMKERRLKKSLDYANKSLIPFVIVLGSQEVETGIINLKNMLSGADVTISIQELTGDPHSFLVFRNGNESSHARCLVIFPAKILFWN